MNRYGILLKVLL